MKSIVEKPVRFMRYREAKDTIISSLHAARILYRLGQTEQAKNILSPKLRQVGEPLRRDPVLQEFESFWKELYAWPGRLKGKISRVDPNGRFVIIEVPGSPVVTFLGHINHFQIKTNNLSNSLIGKTVIFTPSEATTKTGQESATSIEILAET